MVLSWRHRITIIVMVMMSHVLMGQRITGIVAGSINSGTSSDAPLAENLIYHLNGSIEDDTVLVDIINGYNFKITNNDFDSQIYGGLPFKSIATISAPSLGAAKTAVLAIDVNNFWYDVGDNPNEIPITAFFQNIDFANQLFCKNEARVVDDSLDEVLPPLLTDICGYSSAQTIDIDFTDYFGSEITRSTTSTTKWVSKAGDDGTGDGTWATPWLTIQHAEDNIDDGDTIYVLGGLYDEDNGSGYLHIDNNTHTTGHTFVATGGVTVTSPGTTAVVYSYRRPKTFNGFVFDGEGNTTACIGGSAYLNEQAFYRCKFTGATTTAVAAGSIGNTYEDCVSDGQVELYMNYLSTCKGNLIKRGYITGINTYANTYTLHYNKFVDGTEPSLYVTNGASTSMTLDIKYNRFTSRDVCTSMVLSSCTALTIERNKFYSATGGTAFRGLSVADAVTTGDACTPSVKYNYFEANHEATVAISLNAESLIDPEVMYNVFVFNHESTNVRAISFSTALGSGAYKANYNRIFINAAKNGYGIESGETGADFFTDAEIIGNYVRGHLYENPTVLDGGLHGIAASRGTDIKVAYNRIEYVPLGIVTKGGATAYTGEGVYGNMIYECQAAFYIRQCDGIKYYNNTIANDAVTMLRFGAIDDEDGNNSDNVVIENNIFHSTLFSGPNPMFYIDEDVLTRDGVMFDNNIYNPPGSKTEFIIDDAGTPNEYTLAQATTNGWAQNGTIEDVDFVDLSAGDLTLDTGSNGIGDGNTLAAAYDDNLDGTTDWNTDDSDVNPDNSPVIVTKQQTGSWDIGAYVE